MFELPEGLSSAEALARKPPAGEANKAANASSTTRSAGRASLFTVFNLNLVALAGVQLMLGSVTGAAMTLLLLVATSAIRVIKRLIAEQKMEDFRRSQTFEYSAVRDGKLVSLPSDEVVQGDVLIAGPGEQIIADGTLIGPRPITVDYSIRDGEDNIIPAALGEKVNAGGVVLTGRAVYVTETPVPLGGSTFGGPVEKPTRLEKLITAVLRILLVVVLLFVALLISNYFRVDLGEQGKALLQAAPVIFSLIPTGMYLMIIVAYAAGRVELAQAGGLVKSARAVETLAETSVVCFTDVGALLGTSVSLELCGDNPVAFASGSRVRQILGDLARSTTSRAAVMRVMEEAYEGDARAVLEECGEVAALGWMAVTYGDKDAPGTYVLGSRTALEANLNGEVPEIDHEASAATLVLAHRTEAVPLRDVAGAPVLPDQLTPLAVITISEDPKTDAVALIDQFRQEGVRVKIFWTGGSKMVLRLLRAAGMKKRVRREIKNEGTITGKVLRDTPVEQWATVAKDHLLFQNLSPTQIGELVRRLRMDGSFVTVVGDGTADLPALRQASLAVAQPASMQAALSVADMALRENNPEGLLRLMQRGRGIVGGLLDVMKLNLTMVTCTALLILYVRTLTVGFPYLSSQATVISALTATIPSIYLGFFAPPRSSNGYSSDYAIMLLRFVLPAGVLLSIVGLIVYQLEINTTASVSAAQMAVAYTLLYSGLALNVLIRPEPRFSALVVALGVVAALIPAFPFFRRQFGFFWMEPIQYLFVAAAVLAWLAATVAVWKLLDWLSAKSAN